MLCRKSWVFCGFSGFLRQGKLTGWVWHIGLLKAPFVSLQSTSVCFTPVPSHGTQSKKVIYVRDKRPSSIRRVGKFLSGVPWDFMVSSIRSCEENLNNFTCIINYALDILTPLKAVVKNHNDRLWMNNNLRSLINIRKKAFAKGNQTLYKMLRNKVIVPEKGVASCIMKIRSKI